MNKSSKRIFAGALCVVLCVIMAFSSFSVLAAAVEPGSAGETTYCAYNTLYQVNLTQTKLNYTDLSAKVKNARSILAAGYADSIKVTAQMYYNKTVVKSASEIFELSNKTVSMKLPTFGKYIAYVEFIKDGSVVKKTDEAIVGIAATEYNICPVNASFPVVYLTLGLWDITKTADGQPIPTFIMLNRTAQYNWDALPENVYGQPNLTDKELRKKGSFVNKTEKMKDYIADLIEISPEGTKYNLYINDAYVKLILRLLDANGIDESNYTVKMLSDGSGSYANFNSVFNVENATEQYNQMCENWKNAKAYAEENGEIPNLTKFMPEYGSSRYAYVAASTSGGNVEWWVARTNGTLSIPNDKSGFLDTVKANPQVVVKAMNSMLVALQAKGEKVVEEFKTLFNFNGEMFADAESQNKPVMLFVGSWATTEDSFEDFAKFVVAYYGDSYVYYYKGHPATPTALHPDKQEQLARLGIADVESSIPAELIFFFYPEIYAAGYSSTTFQSVNPDKTLCFFNVASDVTSPDFLKNANCYMNHIKAESPEAIKKLCDETKLANGKYFLCEIKGSDEYDIAIWDAESSVISFYKQNADANEYTFVSSREATQDQSIELASTSVELKKGEIADIAASAKTALSYESSNEEVAKVSADGKITATGFGDAKITVKASSSVYYKSAEATVDVSVKPVEVGETKLSATSFVYNAKVQKPTVIVKDAEGKAISSKNYAAEWSNASSKAVGTYTVKLTFNGIYDATKTLTYKIIPQQVTGLKVSSEKTTSVKLSWVKVTGAKYYKVEQSTDGKKWTVAATASTNSQTVSKLKAGTKYQFRVTALDSTKKLAGKASAVLKTGTLTLSPAVKVASTKSKTATVTITKVAGASKYIIYKSTDNKKWTNVTTTTKLTYNLTKLTAGSKIYVKVVAVNAYGKNSAASAVKNVTVKK